MADGAQGDVAITVDDDRNARKANIRLAVVLALVAIAFYVGILVLKHP